MNFLTAAMWWVPPTSLSGAAPWARPTPPRGGARAGRIPGGAELWRLFGSESESTDTRVIQSIKRKEQVVLLSLGIQGSSERTEKSIFLGVEVPGSDRATFMQYSFNAKLGMDGRDVRIVTVGEKKYRISIPEYTPIGHSDEDFRLVAENNGVLSFITPENARSR